jgi:hypothetical protein
MNSSRHVDLFYDSIFVVWCTIILIYVFLVCMCVVIRRTFVRGIDLNTQLVKTPSSRILLWKACCVLDHISLVICNIYFYVLTNVMHN